jgi:hypothetical protein
MKKEELVAIINELQDAVTSVQEGGYCPVCDKEFDEDSTDEHTPECQDLYDRIDQAQGDA